MFFSNLFSRNNSRYSNRQNGITLVALVVTIVVLLILTGITITMLFGENGIIKKAQGAAEATKNAQDDTVNGLANLESAMNEALGDTVVEISTLKSDFTKANTKAKDAQGNIVTIPKGFKVVEGTLGEEITVQNGVVVEDSAGNQFVWIPVGNVNIINDDGSKSTVNIELARYNFTTSSSTVEGSREIIQTAKDYATKKSFVPTGASGTHPVTEYATRNDADGYIGSSSHTYDLNAIAKNLAEFIDSVIGNEEKGIKANGGYYLARYEASKNETDNTKPASKYNKAIWTNINQIGAALASRKMYLDNKDVNGNAVGVESDLVNSYAWDTAIVYVEKMKTAYKNYANSKQLGTNSGKSLNTGKHNDKVCNIHDLSGNVSEWSTENSYIKSSAYSYPCVSRGGFYYNRNLYTAFRSPSTATTYEYYIGFRTICYIK